MGPKFIQTVRPLLTEEEEKKLFEKWINARNSGNRIEENKIFTQITIHYSPIVRKLARKMNGYNLDPSEVINEALLALVKAAVDFKPEKGFKFSTYAMNCVRGTLFTYVSKNFFITNICNNSNNKKVFFRLRRIMREEMKKGDHSGMTNELAERLAAQMEVDIDTVFMMDRVIRDPYSSLNQKVGLDDDEGATHQDMLVSNLPAPDDELEDLQISTLHKQLIEDAMDTLDERTRYIVHKQRLVDEDDRWTLEALSKRYSISKERTRQLRERGIQLIESHIRNELNLREFTSSDLFPVD